ncbi:hemolysin family protein [Paramicrobacterium agarici]|uniref:CBS domain containing-hemolysin-like protein n=1 Tax=Paramicrobacterium agarici TaxID=630514 RepID=A0A2A9DXX0_9MICO|nr:hemolysin family protein [Microbacterium agarici]PFG31216.1 CBS domain containing-hemolysin-like protein [Microbacterium agarici]
MLLIVFVCGALALIAFAGLMTAADAAIGVKSRNDIQELAQQSRDSRSLNAIATDPGAHMNSINFMRIFAETTAAVLVTLVFAQLFTQLWIALLLSAFIMTLVSFVLVGASPRSFGRNHADAILRITGPLIHFVRVLLGPIAHALMAIGNRVTPGVPREISFSSEEQLLSMVDEATEMSVLEEDDRELIHSIFEFNDTFVREVMIPRTDMVSIDHDTTVMAALGVFLSTGISRAPVVSDDVDEVLGVLYLKDLARVVYEGDSAAQQSDALGLVRPAMFVPESKKVDDLLQQMQGESNHLAMVVDEYGGIAGLVTLEDLIEELIGDIADEYDRELQDVEKLSTSRYRVSSRLSIDELGDLFDMELEDDDVDSVGGLLAKALDRLPVPGDTVTAHGLTMTAERTTGRQGEISTIIVEREPDTRAESPADEEWQ